MHQKILDTLPLAIAKFSQEGDYLYCNQKELELRGLSQSSDSQLNIFEQFSQKDKVRLKTALESLNNEINFEYTKDKSHFNMHLVKDIEGNVLSTLTNITNIVKLKKTLLEDQENIKRLDDAVKGANIGVWDFFPQEGKILANETWVTQKKYKSVDFRTAEELFSDVKDGLNKWASLVHPDDLEATGALIEKHLNAETEIYEAEFRMKCGDGKWRWIYDLGQVFQRDSNGTAIRMNGVHIDITKIKELQLELDFLASYDTMTGIHNRRKFFEISEILFSSTENMFAVIIDIDKFKSINDTHGHPFGDKILVEVTKVISTNLEIGCEFGRLGGDEFAIICVDKPIDSVSTNIESIRNKIENLEILSDDNRIVKVSISSGIARKSDETTNLDALLKNADLALYEAKDSGRNKVIFRT